MFVSFCTILKQRLKFLWSSTPTNFSYEPPLHKISSLSSKIKFPFAFRNKRDIYYLLFLLFSKFSFIIALIVMCPSNWRLLKDDCRRPFQLVWIFKISICSDESAAVLSLNSASISNELNSVPLGNV